jgi:hypothetical protein
MQAAIALDFAGRASSFLSLASVHRPRLCPGGMFPTDYLHFTSRTYTEQKCVGKVAKFETSPVYSSVPNEFRRGQFRKLEKKSSGMKLR